MILSDPNASAKVIAGGLLHRDGRVHASPKTKVIGMDGRRDAVAAIRSEVKAPTWEPHSDRSASAPLPARTLERAGDTAHLVPAMPLPTVKIGRYTDPVPGTEVVKGTGIAVPQFSISTSPAPHTPHKVPKGHLPPPPPAVAPRRAAQAGPLPPAHCAGRPGGGRSGGAGGTGGVFATGGGVGGTRGGADVGTAGAPAAGVGGVDGDRGVRAGSGGGGGAGNGAAAPAARRDQGGGRGGAHRPRHRL